MVDTSFSKIIMKQPSKTAHKTKSQAKLNWTACDLWWMGWTSRWNGSHLFHFHFHSPSQSNPNPNPKLFGLVIYLSCLSRRSKGTKEVLVLKTLLLLLCNGKRQNAVPKNTELRKGSIKLKLLYYIVHLEGLLG